MNHRIVATVIALSFCIHAEDWKPAPDTLMTQWAKDVDPAHPLPEYPRPQMVRKEWANLNGLWDYAITPKDAPRPTKWDGKILVPFCVESALSGVKKPLDAEHRLWYRRTFSAPDLSGGNRLLLHFGAVDWEASVSVNAKEVGTHKGGYDGFSFDITDSLKKSGDNELIVSVWDPTGANRAAHGKQSFAAIAKPAGIFYTPCSGIWQTVWLEPVPASHIKSIRITPDFDHGEVEISVEGAGGPNVPGGVLHEFTISDGEKDVFKTRIPGGTIRAKLEDFKPWTPESPFLYKLTVRRNSDEITSYFAMRKISLGKDEKGVTRIFLNNKPCFMSGPLDQGFWPDGIYTAPTDEALKYDIEITKKLGFNATRKHVKVEPQRWYYWCDKLGLLVWQDMPSGGVVKNSRHDAQSDGGKASDEAATQFESELHQLLEQHRNHPSIIMWVVFNEGWGQYDTKRLTERVKQLDPTRLVNDASGWVDMGAGDVHDMHHYPAPATYEPEEKRAAVLGEFGGLGLPVAGHQWVASAWGYQNMADASALTRKYIELWREVWRLRNEKGMSAAIYTQLTDVETESNGLLTYDRKVIKVDRDKIAAAVAKGEFPPPPVYKTIVPTAEAEPIEWRYTFERPAADWMQPSFDDSSWKKGPAGFGKSASDQGKVRTEWGTSNIWLRRRIDLPEGEMRNLHFRVYHDEDAEVYLNGTQVAKMRRYNDEYEYFDPILKSIDSIKPGKNVLAVHCHQTVGGQYIDVGIVREEERK